VVLCFRKLGILLLGLLILFGSPESDVDQSLEQLRKVVGNRTPTFQTEQLSGQIKEFNNTGVVEKEFSFEAARSAINELVVSTRIFANGRNEMKQTLLRPDNSFYVFKSRDTRESVVSIHTKSLQFKPMLLHEQLGSNRKELHANLFEDYFFREYLAPVLNQTVGYHLVDFHPKGSSEFSGTLFFNETTKIHFRDKTISFVLQSGGGLKQWSYPLQFSGDPNTYRCVTDFERTPDGKLLRVEQKYLNGETVGYKKIYTVEKHEINIPLPVDQFSLTRFGLQERTFSFPLFWLIFIAVTIVCLSSIAVFRLILR